ncbi:ZIP family zinc transporter [soil metagenome]
MTNLGASALWGLLVGTSLVAGALTAVRLKVPESVSAVVSAFGGGLLLAAIAFELVPDADKDAGVVITAAGLLGGTLIYVGADAWLTRNDATKNMRRAGHAAASGRSMHMDMPDHSEAARGETIAAGLFVDGVPESMALGLTVAEGSVGAALLVGILVGNLVEAYGAAQPIIAGGHSKGFAIGLLGGIGVALAGATILGGTLLPQVSPALIGAAEAVAAGAVLAVVSISIIPYAFEEVSSIVATAAVVGFIGGYVLT